MNKSVVIRYISGESSPEEREEVLSWVSKSKENEAYFLKTMNLWIATNLPEEKATDEEVEEMMKLVDKKMANKKRTFPKEIIYLAAASIVLLISLSIQFIYFNKNSRPKENLFTYNVPTSKMLYTDKGVKGRIMLPDSTIVWLNSDSKLHYPQEFSGDIREVALNGEAFFEVKSIPEMPMIVKTTKGFSVQVLGTTFNLKSYDSDDRAEATLFSGNINLILENPNGGKPFIQTIKPNQTITINNSLKSTIINPEEPEIYSAWKDGRIIFDETPLDEALKTLNRWYGIDFVIEDSEILKFKFSARFGTESINEIMDLLRLTSYIDYTVDEKIIYLSKR